MRRRRAIGTCSRERQVINLEHKAIALLKRGIERGKICIRDLDVLATLLADQVVVMIAGA